MGRVKLFSFFFNSHTARVSAREFGGESNEPKWRTLAKSDLFTDTGSCGDVGLKNRLT